MSKRLILRPQVYLDLDEIAAYIQKANPQSAIRFLEQAESTFDSLADMPGLGSHTRYTNQPIKICVAFRLETSKTT